MKIREISTRFNIDEDTLRVHKTRLNLTNEELNEELSKRYKEIQRCKEIIADMDMKELKQYFLSRSNAYNFRNKLSNINSRQVIDLRTYKRAVLINKGIKVEK